MIRRLLVANRGEIARRVFRTCRDLGIETVAVFSEADADLPFVSEADAAVALPGNAPADTYLRGDLLVAAARAAEADAVHPGYGFLSESAGFARLVHDAGLLWVGPTPAAVEQMGSKVEARKLMADAGVPVLPELAPAAVTDADLPLLVKASAGGGGRGMRVVRTTAELGAAVEQASAEAASAFGDPTVFCEPYRARARHVEVQVLGDRHGTVVVVGDRDCSLQRRHQKVVEEAPAPYLSDEARHALHDAARTAAAAIGYVGAGTVEFLYDPVTDRFWFLEMNTRLQVEHTVTECVSGLDLVEQQIRIAEGRPVDPAPPAPRGHAVEVRLYAESPADQWRPQSGRLVRLEVPGPVTELAAPASYGIRLDAGYRSGSVVGTHYDAMLAKVVAWSASREEALRSLAGVLRRTRVHGVRTNRDLLVGVLQHPSLRDGAMHTALLDETPVAELEPARPASAVPFSALAAALARAAQDAATRRVQPGVPVGWRNVRSQPQLTRFAVDDGEVAVRWYGGREGFGSADDDAVLVVEVAPDRVVLAEQPSGLQRTFAVLRDAADPDRLDVESSLGHVALRRLPRFTDPAEQVAPGSLLAPMPGAVVSVAVATGHAVVEGQPVLVLEAMKMQHTVRAPHDGVVAEVAATVGAQVAAGTVLAVVHPDARPGDVSPGQSGEGDSR